MGLFFFFTIYTNLMKKTELNLKLLLGKRIRSLRVARGWTQQDLGEKAGISYKFIGEIERGKQNPSFSILAKISKALNIDLKELFRFSHEILSRKELENEVKRIIKDMADDELRHILLLIQAIYPFKR